MHQILQTLGEALTRSRWFAYCRLVATVGSTPQKAGATMLLFPDQTQAGTLGGGCLEAFVRRVALMALGDGLPRVETFALDQESQAADGAICGGKATVFIQPVLAASAAASYYQSLHECASRGGATEVIVFDSKMPDLSGTSCYLFGEAGALLATLRGTADPPAIIRDHLKPLADRPRPHSAAGVSFLPTLPRCPLVVIGGGHIGQAVAALARDLEFDVCVVDDRPEFVTADRFPTAARRIAGDLDDVLPRLDITPDTYCLIVTRGHCHDQQSLWHVVQRNPRYVGMIGSRRKIRLIYENLMELGISAESLQRVYAPLGIDIGSQTVPEIAISICAELVSHRNRGGHVPGRPAPVAVNPPEQHDR
ncbi:MAG: XdhC family protein [Planctomycetes bacterium]|nr:XdhC family protein [Planctomycetota bacterium]